MRKHGFTFLWVMLVACLSVQADTTSSIVWSRGLKLQSEGCCGPAYYTIWRMNDDGTGKTALTTTVADQHDRRPSICPSARRIVFDRATGTPPQTDIYKMGTNGTSQTNLTPNTSSYLDEDPDCGLDGQTERIVFRSTRDHASGEIYKMNVDGSSVTRLTTNNAIDTDPTWCGSRIFFERPVSGYYRIFSMEAADGTDAHQETLGSGCFDDRYPTCNPASTFVAFGRTFDPPGGGCDLTDAYETDIIKLELNTGVETNETNGGCPPSLFYSHDRYPSWSPGGSQITFTLDEFSSNEEEEVYKFAVGDLSDGEGCTAYPSCGSTCIGSLRKLTYEGNDDPDVEPDWGEIAQ